MNRRLIIDGQVFHTPAWHRGMGKYSLELITVLQQLNSSKEHWDKIEILLSSKIALEDDVVRTIKMKADDLVFIYLPLKADEITNAQGVIRRNRKVVDAYIAGLLNENPESSVDFLILSPMQGGICSVFPSDSRVKKAAVFYDVIPFMFHEVYLRNSIAEIENLTKIAELLRANIYLAISKTVANDLAIYLGVDPSRIRSIDGGPIEHGVDSKKVSIPKPFILMPTGNDLRKNNRLGIIGFSEFNKRNNNKYTLAITSSFDPDQVAELLKIDTNVIFTGNISGAELNYLYEECEALLFPSEYEGLGLPVLEAMEKNKPVACSDISVFREISATAMHFFDPKKGTSIAEALSQALVSKVDKQAYKKVLERYTWEKSGKEAITAMKQASLDERSIRKDVSVFAPSPVVDSPIARTVQRLHSELSRQYRVRYFLDGVQTTVEPPRPNMFSFVKGTQYIADDAPIALKPRDAAIYHLDNTAQSAKTLFTALAHPGILILYSLDMSEAWKALMNEQAAISKQRYNLEKKFNAKYEEESSQMISSLVARQKAVVVFSDQAKTTVEKILEKLSVDVIVVRAHYPVSSLVYESLLPSRVKEIAALTPMPSTNELANFADAETSEFKKQVITTNRSADHEVRDRRLVLTRVVNDRQFEEAVSRLSMTFSGNRYASLESLEANRYGVVPAFRASLAGYLYDQPDKTSLVDSSGGLSRFVDAYRVNPQKLKLHGSDMVKAAQDHSYSSFVDVLGELIDKEIS